MKLLTNRVVQIQKWKFEHSDELTQKHKEMEKDGWKVNYQKSSYENLFYTFERIVVQEDFAAPDLD